MKYEERIDTEMEDAFGNAPFEIDFDTKQKLRNEEPMIPVSQVAFMNSKEGYLVAKSSPVSSEWLISVHVMVASFTGIQYNIKGKELPHRTHPLNIDMICTLLNFDSRTSARQKKKIGQALEALCEKGILSVETLDGSEVDFTDYKKLFIAEQSLATVVKKEKDSSGHVIKENVSIERAHLSLPRHALIKITQEIDESNAKPDDVVKLIATYASVVTNINKSVVDTKIEDGVEILDLPSEANNFGLMNATKGYLSFAGLELISSRMGISPTTASDRIKRLCEMRILFAVKVKHPNTHEKHTYCRFEHVDMMLIYYKAMSMSNSADEYEQLISINSAYNIEYEDAKNSSQTTQTPSEIVTEQTEEELEADTESVREAVKETVIPKKEIEVDEEEITKSVTETETEIEEDSSQADNANNLAKEFNITDEELRQYKELAEEFDCSVDELLADEVSRKQRELEQDNFENVEGYQESIEEADVIDFERVTEQTEEESDDEMEADTEAVSESDEVSEADEVEDMNKSSEVLAMLGADKKTKKKIKIAKHSMKHVLKNDLTAIFNGGTSSRYEEMTEKD